MLVQVSQYAFAVCSYKEKKAEPVEMLQLKGYTVDYCDSPPGMFVMLSSCDRLQCHVTRLRRIR